MPAATTAIDQRLVAYVIAAQVGLLSNDPNHPRLIFNTSIPVSAAYFSALVIAYEGQYHCAVHIFKGTISTEGLTP